MYLYKNFLMNLKNNKIRLFEMMNKINPDFIIKEIDTNTSNTSFVNDSTLSVGELKAAINLYLHSKTKEEALANSKKLGADVTKCLLGLISVAGFVAGTVLTGGGLAVAAVASSTAIGVASTIATADDTRNVFKKLLGPKAKDAAKTPSGFMQLLNIDPEVSILLDDKIENAFVEYAVRILNSMADTEPVPNFFNQLKIFIRDKYAQIYNIGYGQQ